MYDIIELQHKLSAARGEDTSPKYKARLATSNSNSKYRPRTADIDHSHDASELLELGVDPHEVSDLLGMHPSEVERIQEYNQRRRKFLTTGNLDLPGQMTGFSVFQR